MSNKTEQDSYCRATAKESETVIYGMCWEGQRITGIVTKMGIQKRVQKKKKRGFRTSLVVQWLRLQASTSEDEFDPWTGKVLHASWYAPPPKKEFRERLPEEIFHYF